MPAWQRVERSRRVPGSPEEVWRRLLGPGGLAWLGRSVQLPLQAGARGVVVDDRGAVLDVLVLQVRPGLLRWCWGRRDGTSPPSEVALRLEAAAGPRGQAWTRVLVDEVAGEGAEPAAGAVVPR